MWPEAELSETRRVLHRMPREPETEPGRVVVIDGEVVQDGPDGVAVSMTPDAAEVTAHRLVEAAVEARNPSGDPD
jgi:hypothetical protein